MSLITDSSRGSYRPLEVAPIANKVLDNSSITKHSDLLNHQQSSSSHAPTKHHQHPTSSHPSTPKENYQNLRDQQPHYQQQQQQQPYNSGSNNKRHWQDTKHISSIPKPERKRAATRQSAIKPVTAFELLQKARSQETKDNNLYLISPGSDHTSSRRDNNKAWLQLGLGITELAGEAGSGKSQMAMNLCVQAVMRNNVLQRTTDNLHGQEPTNRFGSRAIYISLAGGQASLSRIAYRMQQMADAQHQQQQQQSKRNIPPQNQLGPHNNHNNIANLENGASSPAAVAHPSVLSQILTHSVRNQEDLFTLLREDLPLCLQQGHQQSPAATNSNHQAQETSATTKEPPVAVVVLDSIADLFRLGNSDGAEDKAAILKRSYLLFELSALLRELSDRYKVPILVVNQVSCDFASNSNLPALGLSWANCINASYVIRRPKNQTSSNGNGGTSASTTSSNNGVRHIFLAKSSTHTVNQMGSFVIDADGVRGIPSTGNR